MSTLGAAGKVPGTNKTSLLRINNRHSMFDATLNRSLLAYQREYVFNVAGIDFEKRELKTFLRRLYRCESDNDPFARRYMRGHSKQPEADMRLSTLPEIEEVLRAQLSRLSDNEEFRGQSAVEKLPSLEVAMEPLRGKLKGDKKISSIGYVNHNNPGRTCKCSTYNVRNGPQIDTMLAVLPNRHNCSRARMYNQVKRFCDKMESFKNEQRKQGNIAQTPSVF